LSRSFFCALLRLSDLSLSRLVTGIGVWCKMMPMLKEVAVELTDTFFLYDFFERPGLFVCHNTPRSFIALFSHSVAVLLFFALFFVLLSHAVWSLFTLWKWARHQMRNAKRTKIRARKKQRPQHNHETRTQHSNPPLEDTHTHTRTSNPPLDKISEALLI
jgi:hypothetical protein